MNSSSSKYWTCQNKYLGKPASGTNSSLNELNETRKNNVNADKRAPELDLWSAFVIFL